MSAVSETGEKTLSSSALALVEALRPKQWIKNGILFVALVFSRHYLELSYVIRTIEAVAIFCILSSCGYIFNDMLDIEADRGHPRKRHRPFASGRLPVWAGVTFMGVGISFSLAVSFMLSPEFGITALSYLILTFTYTLYIKHVVILDVMAIAAGFILRAVAGATAISVMISPWFLICTAFASLFVAMSKRLSELTLLDKGAGKHRKNLEDYTPESLDRMISVVTAGTIISYALYTFDVQAHPDKPRWLMLTIPFVLYGVFRYLYLVARFGEGGAPELTLLKDRPLQVCILMYVVTVMVVLQLG